jgi:hypothetical protein
MARSHSPEGRRWPASRGTTRTSGPTGGRGRLDGPGARRRIGDPQRIAGGLPRREPALPSGRPAFAAPAGASRPHRCARAGAAGATSGQSRSDWLPRKDGLPGPVPAALLREQPFRLASQPSMSHPRKGRTARRSSPHERSAERALTSDRAQRRKRRPQPRPPALPVAWAAPSCARRSSARWIAAGSGRREFSSRRSRIMGPTRHLLSR